MFIVVFVIFEMEYSNPAMIVEVKNKIVYLSDGAVITMTDTL